MLARPPETGKLCGEILEILFILSDILRAFVARIPLLLSNIFLEVFIRGCRHAHHLSPYLRQQGMDGEGMDWYKIIKERPSIPVSLSVQSVESVPNSYRSW